MTFSARASWPWFVLYPAAGLLFLLIGLVAGNIALLVLLPLIVLSFALPWLSGSVLVRIGGRELDIRQGRFIHHRIGLAEIQEVEAGRTAIWRGGPRGQRRVQVPSFRDRPVVELVLDGAAGLLFTVDDADGAKVAIDAARSTV